MKWVKGGPAVRARGGYEEKRVFLFVLISMICVTFIFAVGSRFGNSGDLVLACCGGGKATPLVCARMRHSHERTSTAHAHILTYI